MRLIESMWETAKYLCANIMGCKLAYVQSDEISLLLTDYDNLTTQAWFDKNVQKMVSVSASMATMAFNKAFEEKVRNYEHIIKQSEQLSADAELNKLVSVYTKRIGTAMFDSRAFIIPEAEVANALLWRQMDATRNSISMLAQANFSHKELLGKSCNEMQDMLFTQKGINFNDLPVYLRRGACIIKETYTLEGRNGTMRSRWTVDKEIPIFSQDREYIERYL